MGRIWREVLQEEETAYSKYECVIMMLNVEYFDTSLCVCVHNVILLEHKSGGKIGSAWGDHGGT